MIESIGKGTKKFMFHIEFVAKCAVWIFDLETVNAERKKVMATTL